MTDEFQPDEAPPKKKSGLGGIVGIAGLAVAAAASSFGVSYFMAPAEAANTACETTAANGGHPPPIATANQVYVPLDEVLITIGSAPATRYLKMNLVIVTDKSGVHAIEDAKPVLMDAFNNYLRAVELTDFEDPAFYSIMRDQLSRRAELVLGSAVADGVLVTEFLLR